MISPCSLPTYVLVVTQTNGRYVLLKFTQCCCYGRKKKSFLSSFLRVVNRRLEEFCLID